ncbi:2OG-Fe(II) oxygenase [Hyphococcus formosus]|uniref:2OG-Fe(II) oxygenase n=1 Tax=Hyphococcus formosus TaxID=3143534 RepID=UPI00398A8EDD
MSTTIDEMRWKAVVARDARANGQFWSCVRTTGVYCLPSCAGRPKRENVIFAARRADAERAGFRPCKRCRPDRFVSGNLSERLGAIDWSRVTTDLNQNGWASLGRILNDSECADLIDNYDTPDCYRSTVHMRRHSFGEGEYKYFSYPLPPLVAELRTKLYAAIVPVARAWTGQTYPADHADYRRQCKAKGQTRPTPLILKYGPGDYNRLHQDLYGDEVFPIQIAILLSQPGKDFDGGEFVMTEQSPRKQSRAMVAPLEKGFAIAFAVNERPKEGARGTYKVKMRHGVSEIRSGSRYCLGIIFHNAI